MLSLLFSDLLSGWLMFLLLFLAGVADGIRDALMFRYPKMGWQPEQFWNPSESWKNKYKNWPSDQRPRFPFAKTLLVWLTDGWHLFQFINTVLLALALVAVIYGPVAQSNAFVAFALVIGAYKAGFAVYYWW